MEWVPLFISFVALLAVALSAYFLFRSGKRSIFERAPFFAVFPLTMAFLALAGLPTEMPALFEKFVGHSVDAQYQYPAGATGLHECATWRTVRWLDPIRTAWLLLLLVALIWSVMNILGRRNRLLNAISLLGSVFFLLLSFWVSQAAWI